MKKGLGSLLVAVLICVAVLSFGMSSWNSKITQSTQLSAKTEHPKESLSEVTDDGLVDDKVDEVEQPPKVAFADNLDEKTKAVISSRLDAGNSVNLLVIGSPAMEPAAERFKTNMKKAFDSWVVVNSISLDMTSQEFADNDFADVKWDTNYDIVIYEPLTLENNGLVVIEDEHQHILDFKEKVMEHVSDASFIISPPHPIYKPNYYDTQVKALKTFTDSNKIPYINHWNNWPSTQSEKLLEYVDTSYQVKEKGTKAWADGLTDAFLK